MSQCLYMCADKRFRDAQCLSNFGHTHAFIEVQMQKFLSGNILAKFRLLERSTPLNLAFLTFHYVPKTILRRIVSVAVTPIN